MEESVNTAVESTHTMTAHEVSSKYSPLALAYIGDSIYDLMVKKHFVLISNMQPEKYHKKVTSIVSANAQSAFVDSIMNQLSEDELAVYKRGRNSSPHTKAKNASLENYLKAATIPLDDRADLEACLAYLYIRRGEYGKASSLTTKVLLNDPMNITAVNVKGVLEMREGKYDVAINCFSKIISDFENEETQQARYYAGEIYNNLAICEAKVGKAKDADIHFREAFKHGYPDVAVALFAKVAINPLEKLGANENGSKLANKTHTDIEEANADR